MANLARVRAEWTGSTVTGGGVSTFYFDEAAEGWTSLLANFYATFQAFLPSGTTIKVLSVGDLIDVATGQITGSFTDGTDQTVSGNASGVWAAGVGARFVWTTAGIHNGRRVKGSTFIVPLAANEYDVLGTIKDSSITTMVGAATTLLGALPNAMKIYSRPVNGAGGQASTVLSGSMPDKVSWLRSRRT